MANIINEFLDDSLAKSIKESKVNCIFLDYVNNDNIKFITDLNKLTILRTNVN